MSARRFEARRLDTPAGPLYLAGIVCGPQDLVARTSEAAALAAAEDYARGRWGQRPDGTWSPYPAEWAS